MIQTERTEISNVVHSGQLLELPLNQRDPLEFLNLSAGIEVGEGGESGSSWLVSGNRSDRVGYQLGHGFLRFVRRSPAPAYGSAPPVLGSTLSGVSLQWEALEQLNAPLHRFQPISLALAQLRPLLGHRVSAPHLCALYCVGATAQACVLTRAPELVYKRHTLSEMKVWFQLGK